VADIAGRAARYGVRTAQVDGNDVEAVHATAHEAVAYARQGGGTTLIEAGTMRMLGHAVHDGAEYVPRQLLEEWTARDPVHAFRDKLLREGVAGTRELQAIIDRCHSEVDDAIAFAEASPWPDPARVAEGVYAPPRAPLAGHGSEHEVPGLQTNRASP
jgi:pyruvate dehydrogenase E1 component alpha subunit